MLNSVETALKTVERATTETGRRVTARILDKSYEIGRKCSDRFRDVHPSRDLCDLCRVALSAQLQFATELMATTATELFFFAAKSLKPWPGRESA